MKTKLFILITLATVSGVAYANRPQPVSYTPPIAPVVKTAPVTAAPSVSQPATQPRVVHKTVVTNIPNVQIAPMPDVMPKPYTAPHYTYPAPATTPNQTIHNGSLY